MAQMNTGLVLGFHLCVAKSFPDVFREARSRSEPHR